MESQKFDLKVVQQVGILYTFILLFIILLFLFYFLFKIFEYV